MMRQRYQVIRNTIVQYIGAYALGPGARLPGEIDLAKLCGVSRPVLREALVALEVSGEVERGRRGIYLKESKGILLSFPSDPSPFEILRARILVESATAAQAALFASARDLSNIEQVIRQMAHEPTQDLDLLRLDEQFHLTIARASHNTAMTAIIDGLWRQMFASGCSNLDYIATIRQNRFAIHREREIIFASIAGRNPSDSRRAMKTHLQHLETRLLESI